MTKETPFIVRYTNKHIMNKLDEIHTQTRLTNGTVKIHTKLIYGAFGFTFAVLIAGLSLL